MALRIEADRVLVRCPNWIGDAVAATATLRCLRRNYPKARITLLLRQYVRGVFENAPWFDDMIVMEGPEGKGRGFLATGGEIRRGRYDLALLMTHSFSSAALAWLGRAKRRVGHAKGGRSWLLTDRVRWPGASDDPERVAKVAVYRSLLEYLGCEGAEDQRPELFTSAQDEALADELLARHRFDASQRLLAVAPGAAYGSSKLWPPERFGLAADELCRSENMRAALLTGPGEGEIALQIARRMETTPVTFREGEISFGALKALVRRCALMLCNDSGPRHLAIAYRVPVVVVMGPTDPAVTDSDYAKTVILRQPVPCGPCYLRSCPVDHQCMKLITPDMAVGAAMELLHGGETG
jgi:heptosyltransferase-2